jgi:hypothetical protein
MGIADLFLVNTRPEAPLDADAPPAGGDAPPAGSPDKPAPGTSTPSKVADFVTQQSFLSFTGMTLAAKFVWKGLQKAFGGWADSLWVPFAFCAIFAASQFMVSMTNADSSLRRWTHVIPAGFIATTNALVLFAAVQGIDPAKDAVT